MSTVRAKEEGNLTNLYEVFGLGISPISPSDKKLSFLYPKVLGFFQYTRYGESDGKRINLEELDDDFLRGLTVYLYSLIKELMTTSEFFKTNKKIREEITFLSEIVNEVYRDTYTLTYKYRKALEKNDKQRAEKLKRMIDKIKEIKELSKEFSLDKKGSREEDEQFFKKGKFNIHTLREAKGKEHSDLYSIILKSTFPSDEKKSVIQRRIEEIRSVRALLSETLAQEFEKILAYIKIVLPDYPRNYLALHLKPFKNIIIVSDEGERQVYYNIIPSNFRKRMNAEKILEETNKRLKEVTGEEYEKGSEVYEELHEKLQKLLTEWPKYIEKGLLFSKLDKLRTQGVIENENNTTLYIRGFKVNKNEKQSYEVLKVKGKRGIPVAFNLAEGIFRNKSNVASVRSGLKKLGVKSFRDLTPFIGPIINGYKEKKGNFNLVEPHFPFMTLALASALFYFSVKEGASLLFILPDSLDEDETLSKRARAFNLFYKQLRAYLDELPPVPVQGIRVSTFVEGTLFKYGAKAVKLLKNSWLKNTKRAEFLLRTDKSVPAGTFYVIEEIRSDYALPINEIKNPKSPYYGLNRLDIVNFRYKVWKVEIDKAPDNGNNLNHYKISVEYIGTGTKLAQKLENFIGKKITPQEKRNFGILLITEYTDEREHYNFISSLFSLDDSFRNRVMVIRKTELDFLVRKKENQKIDEILYNGYLLFKEEYGILKNVIQNVLKIKDPEDVYMFSIFYPLTYAQKVIIEKSGVVSIHGESFYLGGESTWEKENFNAVIPAITSLRIVSNDSDSLRTAKNSSNYRLLRETFLVERNGNIYRFGGESLINEGLHRLLAIYKSLADNEEELWETLTK